MARPSRRSKKPVLELQNITLIDNILVRFNVLMLHSITWGTLTTYDKKELKLIEKRLKKVREKEKTRFPQSLHSGNVDELSEEMLKELKEFLEKFVDKDGFGDEFNRRIVYGFIPCISALAEHKS